MTGRDAVPPVRSGLKLTYDDFMLFPDDGNRHELIDGEHYVAASPNLKHQQVLLNLTLLIGTWLEAHPIGRMFFAPFDVVFSDFDVVEPDLLYLSNARMADVVTPQHVRGAPELIVEVSSPSTRSRDETIKRRLYERGGVSEYWVVDRISTSSASISVVVTGSTARSSSGGTKTTRSQRPCCPASRYRWRAFSANSGSNDSNDFTEWL